MSAINLSGEQQLLFGSQHYSHQIICYQFDIGKKEAVWGLCNAENLINQRCARGCWSLGYGWATWVDIFPFLPNRHADICCQPKYGLASASTSLLPVIGVLIDTSKMLPNNLFVNTALLWWETTSLTAPMHVNRLTVPQVIFFFHHAYLLLSQIAHQIP